MPTRTSFPSPIILLDRPLPTKGNSPSGCCRSRTGGRLSKQKSFRILKGRDEASIGKRSQHDRPETMITMHVSTFYIKRYLMVLIIT